MQIALLSAEYPPQPGGVGDYTYHLGAALAHQGARVTVLTAPPRGPGPPDGPAQAALPIARWDWRCWTAVIAALDRLRPQVLHLQYQTGAYAMHPAINALPWRLRGLPGRPRLAVTMHDLLPPYLFPKAGPLRRLATAGLIAGCDAVVVTNPDDARVVAAELCRSCAPHTIPIGANIPVAPPHGYDRAAWRARHAADDETLVVYFGLLSRSKGLDTLLAALARLPATVRLLVVGGAATTPQDRAFAEEVAALVGRLGLAARVSFTGHCAPAEVSAHLLAADLCALPFADGASFRRGSLLAALAHGLPVVTTAGPAAAQPDADARLSDGATALLVPPGDAAALAETIARLSGDPALRDRLGQAGRALARQFSWPAIAEQHLALYRGLAPGR